ncbi:MAG: pentapeptide repeat-containing protein [Kiloniellales bacterium]
MSKAAYVYEIGNQSSKDFDRGEIEARDETDARRRLRGKLGVLRLPANPRLFHKSEVAAREAQAKAAKLRYLLRVLGDHHAWLTGKPGGRRADLSRLNLSGVNLRKRNLANADLTDADLTGADLSGANLTDATLVRANLREADLRNADLRNADLSEADLRDAVLTGVKLDGAEIWRTNVKGCVISPKALHAAFECRAK